MSCASLLTLLCFMVKLSLRKIWTIVFPFSKTCFNVLPHAITTSMYCMNFRASPCSIKVWISPWQIIGLYFHPWNSQLQARWTPIQKANCVLRSATKGIEKNVLACLASLTSKSRLLTPLSQHHSSQVTMCSPGQRCNSFT